MSQALALLEVLTALSKLKENTLFSNEEKLSIVGDLNNSLTPEVFCTQAKATRLIVESHLNSFSIQLDEKIKHERDSIRDTSGKTQDIPRNTYKENSSKEKVKEPRRQWAF